MIKSFKKHAVKPRRRVQLSSQMKVMSTALKVYILGFGALQKFKWISSMVSTTEVIVQELSLTKEMRPIFWTTIF